MDGDFLDGVVESTLRSVASQLKIELRKELGRAFSLEPAAALSVPMRDSQGFDEVARAEETGKASSAANTSASNFLEVNHRSVNAWQNKLTEEEQEAVKNIRNSAIAKDRGPNSCTMST
ncbi:unnamed protein product, partial [Prorocentrum cordatum]